MSEKLQIHDHDPIVCKNCHHIFHGKYCSECGQKAETNRFTIKHIIETTSHAFLNVFFFFERGASLTFKELLISPGQFLRNYLSGKRVSHITPIGYVLLVGTISTLLYTYLGDEMMMNMPFGEQLVNDKNKIISTKDIVKYITEHQVLSTLIMIPLTSMVTQRVYKKIGYNYAEHLVVNAFLLSQQSMINSFFMPLLLISDSKLISLAMTFVSYTYLTWSYHQLFQITPLGKSIFKSIMAVLLGYLLLILFSSLVGGVVVGVLHAAGKLKH
ncbi:uncharacterized protein DUF3667 [Arcicella aurantiaca]|uniref:Uncharacterized protein DUF3667 n=1 Tax=Arcicella aurantiaca TaxID=591202 RepID=A0A316DVJ5_9BACT|nr:DUF3667 domain-containing protein [Arcicella aurantiaca]PWK22124.1 uncharacterized protein DUF3667 [Arcicella aurantiaca]